MGAQRLWHITAQPRLWQLIERQLPLMATCKTQIILESLTVGAQRWIAKSRHLRQDILHERI